MATLITTTPRTTTVVPRLVPPAAGINKVGLRDRNNDYVDLRKIRELHMSRIANMPEDADDLNFMFKTNNC